MNDFRNLRVWNLSHALALAVYRSTGGFPQSEQFGLVAQMRRAAVSVPANIAESCGRRTRRDEAHFLHVALGSASELEAEVLLAKDLAYLPDPDATRLAGEVADVKRMLSSLARRTFARAAEGH